MKPAIGATALAFGVAALNASPGVLVYGPLGRYCSPNLVGKGASSHVALTFDDGPDAASTPMFLEQLAALGWTATFFMLGSMVDKNPRLAAEVASAGHEIAVHGYHHYNMARRTPQAVRYDTERAHDAISNATGATLSWFRPPYGAVTFASLLAARRLQLRTVLWTAWGRDWRPDSTPASVLHDLDRGLLHGGTILLHDSDCTSALGAWHSALDALKPLADRLAAANLSVGPVGEHQIP